MSGKVELMAVAKPGDIEKKSFEIIDSEVPEPRRFSGIKWQITRRMVHTTADFYANGVLFDISIPVWFGLK